MAQQKKPSVFQSPFPNLGSVNNGPPGNPMNNNVSEGLQSYSFNDNKS
jgi:hypothetical protein